MDPQQNQMAGAPENKSFGPLIGIIVIIALIVIGGLYFWGGMFSKEDVGSATTTAAVAEDITADIEAGLDTAAIDAEIDLSDIEASLTE